jgi:uncharacterized RDD family membrane protein YckC
MSAPRNAPLVVETPEGVVFSYALATPAVRALAWAVDAAAIAAASSIVGQACALLQLVSQDWARAMTVLLYFVVSVGYGIVLEWRWRGQTLGKRLFGLRVVDAQGLRLQLRQIALRNLMRVFDSLPLAYLVGGIACAVSRNCQRLGDLAANTVVAREQSWEDPDVELLAQAKYNSLLAHPRLAARLRSQAAPEAVEMALRAVAQRDHYEPQARVEVFQGLAEYFRALVSFPPAAVEGLSDEEYVKSELRAIYAAIHQSPTDMPEMSPTPARLAR